ncbi:MAG: hypothetical protein F6J90_39440 [Moorea sp. SIOASIH]|uniref:hypothetical protein n=1 Tax=Moorena sp. SIOASIH TaxID=2607817 RepID=UPI0013BC932A|nr:hypothetical protein [Moorena sp. SIOASIH]NEO42073.1 hypothetical protein [Moorena sp. SIOASIH]
MTRAFTSDFLQYLKSNPQTKVGWEPQIDDSIDLKENPDKYNQHYFQILIFDDLENSPKLLFGTKENIQDQYDIKSSSFPTPGVCVDQEFLPSVVLEDSLIETGKRIAQLSTVRFLLQCRKLSQMMTCTWLDEHTIKQNRKINKTKVKLIRQIFDNYNLLPEEIYWVKENKEKSQLTYHDLDKKISKLKKETDEKFFDLLIKRESRISIALALLLCGQAYYKDENNGNFKRIHEPIFSTYEMVWEYAIDISWDTFYATRIDLSQAGERPKPPYTKVTLGYPPRPSEFSVTQEHIKTWVTAPEKFDDSNQYPFYPDPETTDWNNKQLQFVVPPYPYLPLSCT